MLSRARALVNALPADQTTQEREQLSLLRKKFEARGTTAAKSTKKPKSIPAARAGGKKAGAKKSTAKATQKLKTRADSRPRQPLHQPCRPRLHRR